MGTPLDRVQRWMQAVVVHPGRLREAEADPRTRRELKGAALGDVIRPSATLTPLERVGVYHGMYLLRMEEALESDYPALEHLLGARAFRRLVDAYVQAHPSRTYTLNRLGDHLPEFVLRAPGIRHRAFGYDLARLELAITEVFDAPETASLGEAEIAAVPPEAWERARLVPVSAFRLRSFRFPVNAYLESVKDEKHDHPALRRKDTWLAVWRRNDGMYRLELARPAHDLLADLVKGRPLGKAIAAALRRGGRHAPSEDDLFRWFRQWAAGGMFRAVEAAGADARPRK
jgi:hypothetical protein